VLRWISSTVGLALTVGSVAGILAFALGLIVQAPANAHLAAVQMAEIAAQQKKISDGAWWGAVLMTIALIGMFIAR